MAFCPTTGAASSGFALFSCPTLVMNLRAGAAHGATAGRSPAIAALSFAIAVMAGSEPAGGADAFSRFIDAIEA